MPDIIIKKKEGEKIEINKEPKPELTEQKKGTPQDPGFIEWKISEFIYREKSNDWYWGLGVFVIILLVVSYFTENFLFGAISILGGFAVTLFGTKKPQIVKFRIDKKGVMAEDRLYSFKDLGGFCINENDPDETRLFIELKTGFLSELIIPIRKEDEEKITSFLKLFLKEKELVESLTSSLFRVIGV